MDKKKWLRIVSVYSMIYTVITLLNSVLYLCNGIYEDPSGNWHELDRAVILLIGITAFELCMNLPVKPLMLICDFVYSLFAAGLRLCLVQRTAGASGENGIQGYLDKLYGAFCAAVYGECHCLCL